MPIKRLPKLGFSDTENDKNYMNEMNFNSYMLCTSSY